MRYGLFLPHFYVVSKYAATLTLSKLWACKKKGASRIEQIKKYAVQAGYKKIGIAYCVILTKYARQLEDYLTDSFEVVKVDCKCAKIPSHLLVSETKGISCNPVGQAKILEEACTELNVCLVA